MMQRKFQTVFSEKAEENKPEYQILSKYYRYEPMNQRLQREQDQTHVFSEVILWKCR